MVKISSLRFDGSSQSPLLWVRCRYLRSYQNQCRGRYGITQNHQLGLESTRSQGIIGPKVYVFHTHTRARTYTHTSTQIRLSELFLPYDYSTLFVIGLSDLLVILWILARIESYHGPWIRPLCPICIIVLPVEARQFYILLIQKSEISWDIKVSIFNGKYSLGMCPPFISLVKISIVEWLKIEVSHMNINMNKLH